MTWPARARQRLAALGGVAVPAVGSALPAVERFAPTPVDAQAKLAEVERLIDDLAPGLDEATGHTLDNLINAWGEAWEAEVMAEASEYDALVAGRLSALDPQAAQCRALHDLNGRRLADAKTALAAARERLVGERRPVDDSGDGERGFAPWGGKSFTEPTLLAGRGPAAFASVAVLAVAACADVAAFFQIVQLLLPRQEGEKSLLLVGGLTVVAVTLAHRAGVVLRERHAGSRTAKRWQALLCLLIWLLLGLGAAVIRFYVADPGTGPVDIGSQAGPGSEPSFAYEQAGMAGFFLVLYLGTGVVAALGGYALHQPVRAAYARASRHHRIRQARMAVSVAQLARVEAERARYAGALVAARQRLTVELKQRLAFTEELKQMARMHNARAAQNPTTTDGLFHHDRKPYVWDRLGENR
ncbi:hypothetical protein [Nonomuraea jabiensis]|uniref:hypothetical protein n=1 Tax=Nonomuraea jabiensis TaxID=882448 RepID=UPI003D734190